MVCSRPRAKYEAQIAGLGWGGIRPNMSSKGLLGHVGRGGLSRRGPHELTMPGFESDGVLQSETCET
ncbi:hypothetical protein HaLaN_08235 [Haematococcus lacustris]|uniref:Uncharacterized protein n=1 Tax=Haematococcus lacustris TaxID=44745 RepID=A0A699Z0R3_HAELA|nr:hypothetical protein HaLaN_08235 [Haematococcus lacustris]